MLRPALLLPLLLLACARQPAPEVRFMPPPPAPVAERDPAWQACRAQAERVTLIRERGQVMRNDEEETGRGALVTSPYGRISPNRQDAENERNRLLRECLAGSGPAAAGGR
jgi:hypothetical protein